MFYLRLKDGREITTDMRSDDLKEFHTFLESELGDQAAELFDGLIHEAASVDQRIIGRYKKCIRALEKVLAEPETDRARVENILAELKDIYIDLT